MRTIGKYYDENGDVHHYVIKGKSMSRYLVEYAMDLQIVVEGKPLLDDAMVTMCEVDAHDEYEAYRIARMMNPKKKVYSVALLRCEPNEFNCRSCEYYAKRIRGE